MANARGERRPSSFWLRLLGVLALVATVGCRPPSAPEVRTPPNVLLVTIETLRADHVGTYGYARNTTPNLDRLGRQGATFLNTVSQAPFTLPSVTSLMTGLNPPFHGVRNHPATLSEKIGTLAETFQAAGYQTAAMTRHTWLRRKSGLDKGFDQYHNNKFSAGLDARSLSLAAAEWLENRDTSRPFFLWLHFLDPHLPYTPGYPYNVLYQEPYQDDSQVQHLTEMSTRERENFEPTPYADLSGGPFYDLVLRYYPDNAVLLDLAFWRRSRGSIFFNRDLYSSEDVQEMRDLYDGGILYTDDNLARLLQTLDVLELEESTVVAVTGDHGEALGEHGMSFAHDFTLYDEVLHVPLVVRAPGISPGQRISQQVRVMDLGPTLVELAGLEPREGLEAVSLVPLMNGGTLPFMNAFAESAPDRSMFPENERIYFEGIRGKWRMLRTDRWKLIRIPHPDGDRFELYDLVADPGETRNLYQELPGEAGKLAPILEAYIRTDPARHTEASSDESQAFDELDPAAREQLKTLGYIP